MISFKRNVLLAFICVFFTYTVDSFGARPRKYPDKETIQYELAQMPLNIKSGLQGYFYIAEKMFDNNMHQAFTYTSKALGKEAFNQLGWGKLYYGTPANYTLDHVNLLSKNSEGTYIYQGIEGRIAFAKKFYGGDMNLAFRNMVAVLTAEEKDLLEWGLYYNGDVEQFISEPERLLAKDASGSLLFKGKEGHREYARIYYNGTPLPAYQNSKAVLTKEQQALLRWKVNTTIGDKRPTEVEKEQNVIIDQTKLDQIQKSDIFSGTPKDFFIKRSKLVLKKPDGSYAFQGPLGFALYSAQIQFKSPEHALVTASFLLTKSEYDELSWEIPPHHDIDGKYETERQRLNEYQRTRASEFQGIDGYMAYANLYFAGNLEKTYNEVISLIGRSEIEKLKWGKKYEGHVNELKSERKLLLEKNADGTFKYAGIDGQLAFTTDFFDSKAKPAFKHAKSILSPKEMERLDWKRPYFSSVERIFSQRQMLLVKDPEGKLIYFGPEGYKRYTLDSNSPNMNTSFNKAHSVLNKFEEEILAWEGRFIGTVSEFEQKMIEKSNPDKKRKEIKFYKEILFSSVALVNSRYLGTEGYQNFSDDYFDGDMHLAFHTAKQNIGVKSFRQLKWGDYYHGTVNQLKIEQKRLIKIISENLNAYSGTKGYIEYARKYYDSNMLVAYENVLFALGKDGLKKLGWHHKYTGLVSDLDLQVEELLKKKKDGSLMYKGFNGYIEYISSLGDLKITGSSHGIDFQTAYNLVYSLLSKSQKKALDWKRPHYKLIIKAAQNERDLLLSKNSDGSFVYQGISGYKRYSKRKKNESMKIAFEIADSVLDTEEFMKMGWGKMYLGPEHLYDRDKKNLLSKNEDELFLYQGIVGHLKFAISFYQRDLDLAFHNASAILSSQQISLLGWKDQYDKDYNIEKMRDEIWSEEYMGIEGLARYAQQKYSGDVARAYLEAQVILPTKLVRDFFKTSKWRGPFPGNSELLFQERGRLLQKNKDGVFMYSGFRGYLRFADKYHEGNLQLAFESAYPALHEEEWEKLEWNYKYYGSSSDYQEESDRWRILSEQDHHRYQGISGYILYAKEFHGYNLLKAHNNVLSILGPTKILEREWGAAFEGDFSQLIKEREILLEKDENGQLVYFGREGHLKYANKYFNGNTHDAFQKASSLLEPKEFDLFSWMKRYMKPSKNFTGSEDQYYNEQKILLTLTKEGSLKYFGFEGFIKFADEFYDGNTKLAYKQAFAIFNKKIFKHLQWKQQFNSQKEYQSKPGSCSSAVKKIRF